MSDERHSVSCSEEEDCDDEPLVPVPVEPETQQCRSLVLPEVGSFLYFLALVTQYPLLQFWLFDHFAKEYNLENENDSDVCGNSSLTNSSYEDLEKKVQSEANKYVMYTSFTSNFVAIFPTLLLGPLTDRYGRKFVFYISFLGLFGNLSLTLFIYQYDLRPELLFVTSVLLGLSGSYGLFLAAAFGMVADITSPGKQRAFRVTTLEATIAIAASLGTTLSGIWVKDIGYVWPIAISMGEIVLAAIFILFVTPETLADRNYHPFSCRTLMKSFVFYVKDSPSKRRFKLIICLICFLIYLAAFIGESNFGLLYLLHQPFCWTKTHISIFSGTLSLFKWICVVLFILLAKRWISDPVFAIIGTVSAASGYLLRGLADSNLLIYVGAGTSLLMDLVQPMCRTIMSRSVSPAEQGALFSGIGVLQMIMSAVSGIVMSNIYRVGLDIYLGLPYLVLTGLVSVNIFLLSAIVIRSRWRPDLDQSGHTTERTIA